MSTLAAQAQQQILVDTDSTMAYLANASDPGLGISWQEETFVDSGWSSGTYPVGYETGSGAQNLIQTTVPAGTSSVYTRATFTVADVGAVNNLFLGLDYPGPVDDRRRCSMGL